MEWGAGAEGGAPGGETTGTTGNSGGETTSGGSSGNPGGETTSGGSPGNLVGETTSGGSGGISESVFNGLNVTGVVEVTENQMNVIGNPPHCGPGEIAAVTMGPNGAPTGWQCVNPTEGNPVVWVIITPNPAEPCAPELLGTGSAAFNCPGDNVHGFSWGWALNVYAVVPPHVVERRPFPRGLVALQNEFKLRELPDFSVEGGPNGPGGAGGFWSNTVGTHQEPIMGGEFNIIDGIANYRLGLRWVRVYQNGAFGPPPLTCWEFDERAWNVGRDYGYGTIENAFCHAWPWVQVAYHTYETSSYDLPANGPRADLEAQIVPSWDLQSYQVKVPTWWQGEWAAEWEVAVEAPCPADQQVGVRPRPASPPECADSTNPNYDARCDPSSPAYDPDWMWWAETEDEPVCVLWEKHSRDWTPIDLRRYGYPYPYYKSYKVTECGEFGGREWCQESEDGTVPTPIIESQPIIINWPGWSN
ncbi:MAG: hypothetical protein Kow00120_19130 [Anaerolineae bacterium]